MILRRLILKLWRRRRLQHDLGAELAFHRELAREHTNPIGLGNTVRIEEQARDLWRFNLVEDLWRDVCYAVRSLRRTPGFAVIAIGTLALGIGANTAIFTLMHRIMLASLPVREPSQLVEVMIDRGGRNGTAFSYDALQTFRGCTEACAEIIAFANTTFHAVTEGKPMERLSGQFVPADYFSSLGIVRERLVTSLAAIFGGLALLLAVIGLYGVVSNNVARRTKEIGIRIALGIDQRSAVMMELREVFVLVGAGIVLGLPLAILVTRYADTLLYGLTPDDPLNVIASVAALLLSAFIAGWLPARRASRVDPAVALRIE